MMHKWKVNYFKLLNFFHENVENLQLKCLQNFGVVG